MTVALGSAHLDAAAPSAAQTGVAAVAGWSGVAGVASLGAGAVHAAAIGAHAEHRGAAVTFAVLAAAQIAWGGLSLTRPRRAVTALGAVVGLVALAGWVLAKTSGISFVAGLDQPEAVQTADAVAAGLAAATVVFALMALRAGATRPSAAPLRALSLVAVAVAFFGMVSAGTHAHAGAAHDPSSSSSAAGDHHAAPAPPAGSATAAAADTRDDPDQPGDEHADVEAHASDEHATGEHADGDHGDGGHAATPAPYDPALPIDLGGIEGVTPQQQAMAENIVAVTVMRLGQWSDPAVAEAAGFRSIGDGFLGHEHFVNAEFRDDDTYLDPDRPESLVYDTSSGERRLVAAMYMVDEGTPLDDVPDYGGRLMQWHTHEDLCYDTTGQVRALTDADGNCAPGLVKPVPTPMIHVWIEPNPCGPFAALEGVAGGRIPDGEGRLCDHAHGT